MNRFTFHNRAPHPALRGLVSGLWHYDEQRGAPLRRREMPCAEAVLLVNLGPAIGVAWPDPARETRFDTATGFLARPHPAPARSFMAGQQRGVQVMLTPLGAERLLRDDLDALPAEFLGLHEALGRTTLGDQLAGIRDPEACLDVMEGFLLQRLAEPGPPADPIARAWQRIEATGGRIPIASLAAELGWSRQTFARHFRRRTGLAPKMTARLKRFGTVIARLPAEGAPDWAGLAAEAGYADQAHLIHDVKAFTGLSPAALLDRRLRDGLGFAE
ncbi:AraC family transcriptional regulator [Roseomonas stagni]|uniref:AraC family transcriptional regulator n=1 Tax=Falsiroseomonas algicola TaxID=2716930 RepID=A0A6M1LT31_9PROT|nr:helix-turn-helix domain-containing protein [Falsiroseomonas algicola]NGM23571.1 AraC family transcriptional regulator [Falsiroseomonas algicola]